MNLRKSEMEYVKIVHIRHDQEKINKIFLFVMAKGIYLGKFNLFSKGVFHGWKKIFENWKKITVE